MSHEFFVATYAAYLAVGSNLFLSFCERRDNVLGAAFGDSLDEMRCIFST